MNDTRFDNNLLIFNVIIVVYHWLHRIRVCITTININEECYPFTCRKSIVIGEIAWLIGIE